MTSKQLFLPYLPVCFLLYLVIFHANLFSWINLELLKSFVPDIFMPTERAGGELYNEAILAGTISFVSVFVLPTYYFLQAKKTFTKERIDDILKQQGKIKVYFVSIIVIASTAFYHFKLHYAKQSSLQVKQFITSDPYRYLFMDFACLNMFYSFSGILFFIVISPLFFNAKKEK